jgi:geranylgeranyl diphosphate synthase, type II
MTLQHLSERIESGIQGLRFKSHPENLYEPIAYMLSLGGKRIRPLLVLLGYLTEKDDPETILRQAISVEVFHNFTLMHDDIMDQAPIRRGKPTVYVKWNPTIATLSGDTMLVKAYELLEEIPAPLLPRSLRLFNRCAIEVCEGQQLDMNFETRSDVTEAEYLEMIRLKTAVLLGFGLEFGALLGGAGEQKQQQICDLGVNLGIAFQLMDDYLDTFGDEATFGKQIGGDILADKKTFLLIKALELLDEAGRRELESWSGRKDQPEEKIKAVAGLFRKAGVDTLLKDLILDYELKAERLLADMHARPGSKELIQEFIDQLKQRVR